ncbi:LysR family transcriptional regulator [Methylovirgula sp. 4M-Z18]|uniref:LysR family transcriptional regulator n=1 Tax=Methylovirgula sp. 4M-Z18 TaxID=2293567 RepID=UPI000E2E6BC3|nr:LysR family transcriptional regulator [Methylovirgula sp. 4M-Z18]RFB78112.1 LysR family transcriptional regulator [Methylovirgula sp. 4M-Z18]
MDSLGPLNIFVQVADAGSFTLAGRRLSISSSAVSKAVARLEQKLGVHLFQRSTRAITLTAEGACFLERCRRIFEELERAESDFSKVRGKPSGRLKISVPLMAVLSIPKLTEFRNTYPDIQLEIDCSDRLVNVIDEGFDAVIRTGEPHDSTLIGRKVGSFRLLIVGAPDYLRRRGTPMRPEDLATHDCIYYRLPATGKLQDWALGCTVEADWQPGAAMVVNTLEPQLRLAEAGMGLASIPDIAIQEQLASGALVPVLQDHCREIPFYILWPSSRFMTPRLRAFVDFVIADKEPAKPVAWGR